MRLLLDEMHSPAIAELLSADGWDVEAVALLPDLRGAPDGDVLEQATAARRALVTENIADFGILAKNWATEGRSHAGLIFTHPRRFHRAATGYPGNLIGALRRFLEDPPTHGTSWTWWL